MKTCILALVFLFIGTAYAYKIPGLLESLFESKSDGAAVTDPVLIDEGEETPPLMEGDIYISPERKKEMEEIDSSLSKRNAQQNHNYLWNGRLIPYQIDSSLSAQTSLIEDAMNEFHKSTCLRFVPRTNQKNWIYFVKKSGCYSSVGREFSKEGAQDVSLGEGCHHKKTVVHELMHAIGFWHEQSRSDRDKYVEIYWENIKEGKDFNFERHGSNVINSLGVNYDYNSVVHYSVNAFSKNGQSTITSLGDKENIKKIGPGETLSPLDIIKIDLLYCKEPSSLGVEKDGPVPDSNFAASSSMEFFGLYSPSNGRLRGDYSWCAKDTTNNNYIEVDLGSIMAVHELATQGNTLYSQWVKTYTLQYSSDKVTWQTYKENSIDKVFSGNTDKSSIVKNTLPSPINTRFVRIFPKEFQEWPCMRFGLYGPEPVNKLSPWSDWAPCVRNSPVPPTCQKKRQRFCISTNVAADCPTANAYGVVSEIIQCTQAECTAPIDGNWNRWSSWSSCTKTCGLGTHTRTRKCDDPAPSFNGKNCDGSDTMTKSCQDQPCGIGPDGCSFTKDFCTWTIESAPNIPWIRGQYSTASKNTGPSRDHTAPDASGYYIYLEASGVAAGAKAILRSKEQTGTNGQRCLSFYYNMNGKYMGSLIVKLKVVSTGATHTLTTLTGNKGDQWFSEKVTFSNAQNFILLFEGVRGASWSSDMAIDDISLLWGSCDNPSSTPP